MAQTNFKCINKVHSGNRCLTCHGCGLLTPNITSSSFAKYKLLLLIVAADVEHIILYSVLTHSRKHVESIHG